MPPSANLPSANLPSASLNLSVALSDAGWHPAAWREPGARPDELLTARFWVDQVKRAESGGLDFVTFEDSLAIQSARPGACDDRVDQVRGRLDAVLIAARVAPATSSIGLVPLVTTTHTEPFHVSKMIATLDYVSSGRAGMEARVSTTPLEAALFGRRSGADGLADLMAEAADFVEVVRRLWDSWEDDAEIRDVATGRFVDRERLHYVDFEGRWFSVRGPAITPRPPQGQPVVAVLAGLPGAFELAARSADVVFTTPRSPEDVRTLIGEARSHEQSVGRLGEPLRVFGDLVVLLADTEASAVARKERLDELDGCELSSEAAVFVGSPEGLADLVTEWRAAGLDGVRLRPAVVPHDLDMIAQDVAGLLRRSGVMGEPDGSASLRRRLGLERPESRYAA